MLDLSPRRPGSDGHNSTPSPLGHGRGLDHVQGHNCALVLRAWQASEGSRRADATSPQFPCYVCTHSLWHSIRKTHLSSAKMYKHRFKRWGLRKNLSAAEAREVTDLAAQGQTQLPIIGGRQLGSRRLKASVRQANGCRELLETQLAPRYFAAPDKLHIPESALWQVSRYSQVAFETQLWDISNLEDLLGETSAWGLNLRATAQLVSKSRNVDGFRLLDKCCADVGALLLRQETPLIWSIYLGVLELGEAADDTLALSFIRFVGGMCSIMLGSSHPLTQLCRRIQSMGVEQAKLSASPILRAQLDVLCGRCGPGSSSLASKRVTMMQWLSLLDLVSSSSCFEEAQAIVQDLIHSRAMVHGSHSKFGRPWAADIILDDIAQCYEKHGLPTNNNRDMFPDYLWLKGIFEARRAQLGMADESTVSHAGDQIGKERLQRASPQMVFRSTHNLQSFSADGI